MRRPGRKTRFACAVLAFLLVSVLITVTAPNNPAHGVVLSAAAQNSAASTTTVSNNISVLSDSVSLGSSLHVEGVVSSPSGPWDFATVALHMGDITVARTQANESGAYVFSVPVGLNYVPAVISGSVSVYTVAESSTQGVPAVPSAVVHLPVNAILGYGIVAGLFGIFILGLYLFTPDTKGRFHSRQRLATLGHRLSGWTHGRGRVNIRSRLGAPQRLSSGTSGVRNVNVRPRLASARQRLSSGTRSALRFQERTEAPPQPATVPELGRPLDVEGEASAEELPSQAPAAEQLRLDRATPAAVDQTEALPEPAPVRDTELALETARDLFDQGKNQPAVGLLYSATVTCLSKVHGVTLAPSMTHREKYAALQRAAPDVRAPLRTLTVAYERTTYGGELLTKEQQKTAIEACKSICKLVGRAGSP